MKTRTQAEQLLATDKIERLVARYAIPGAISLVFFSLQTIVDGIIVGKFVGSDALAGVSLVLPAYTLLTSVALVIGVGTQAQMSIGMGQGDYQKTKNALKTGFYSLVSFAVLFCLLINTFPASIASALGSEGVLLRYSVDYIRGLMPFIVGGAAFYFFDYALKSLGHPRFAMLIMVSSVLVNACLSLYFVTRLDMGVYGVGLATGLTVTVGMFFSAIVVLKQLRKHADLRWSKSFFQWRMLGRIVYNGSSEGVSEIAMGITLFLFNLTLMSYVGKDGVAAFSVINYVIFIGTSVLLGVSDGMIPVVSYNFGARMWDRIYGAIRVVTKTNLCIGLVFLGLLWLCGDWVISLFFDESGKSVSEMALQGARIMGFAFLINGFNIFCSSFFTAIDNAKLSLGVASSRGLVFIIVGLAFLPKLFGLTGIWMTIPFAEMMTVIVSSTLLRSHLKKLK